MLRDNHFLEPTILIHKIWLYIDSQGDYHYSGYCIYLLHSGCRTVTLHGVTDKRGDTPIIPVSTSTVRRPLSTITVVHAIRSTFYRLSVCDII